MDSEVILRSASAALRAEEDDFAGELAGPARARVPDAEGAIVSRIDITIVAPVEPAPYRKGAAVVAGHAALYTSTTTRRWQDRFAAHAAALRPAEIIDGPLLVDVLLVMSRPKRLMRRSDPDGLVWAPGKPDADNCRKAVLDALRSWWRDDSLVVAGQTLRVHAEKTGAPRTCVRIRSLGWPTDPGPYSMIGPVFGAAGET